MDKHTIFGSVYPESLLADVQGPGRKTIYGAWVATEEFYKALLKYGTFGEYHFFVRPENINTLKKKISSLRVNKCNLKLLPLDGLPSYFKKVKYTVFFNGDPGLSKLADLRLRYAAQYFPLCAITHTVSYSWMLERVFFMNMLSDLRSFDSITCSSTTLLRAIKNLNKLVSTALRKEKGFVLNYKGRLDHLPLGINSGDYGKIDKADARKRLGLSGDKFIILYFGRLSLYDKLDIYPLLAAFRELLLKNKDTMLILGGKSNETNYVLEVKGMAKNLGILHGLKFILNTSLTKKSLLYCASDIFVSPSDNIQESFGITVLEAMASGLPAVVSDWNGYKDLVIHNHTGFRVPTYWTRCDQDIRPGLPEDDWVRHHLLLAQSVCVDIKEMVRYILILMNNKQLRLNLGLNAKKTAFEKYDWSNLVPKYERLWKELSGLSRGHKISRKKAPLFTPGYFDSFRHYPSKILDEKTNVLISEYGRMFLKIKKFPFVVQPELKNTISAQIIFLILSFLLGRGEATIEDIENHAARITGRPSLYSVRYNLMWLLKKGLIRCGFAPN